MASNINRVIITGNLTSDPDLRALSSGNHVCKLRVAVNTRRKDGATGEWVDKPNYFDVTVFGGQGENAARYLSKGRGVAVDGRLDWSEYQDRDGNDRQAVQIIADNLQFLSSPQDNGNGGGYGDAARFAPSSDLPAADTSDFAPAPAPMGAPAGGGGAIDDDIPF
jgi:single-strand DNA-binding protein